MVANETSVLAPHRPVCGPHLLDEHVHVEHELDALQSQYQHLVGLQAGDTTWHVCIGMCGIGPVVASKFGLGQWLPGQPFVIEHKPLAHLLHSKADEHVLQWSVTSGRWVCIPCNKLFRRRLVKHALATCHGKSHLTRKHCGDGGCFTKPPVRVTNYGVAKCLTVTVLRCSFVASGAYAEYRVTALFKPCKHRHAST